MRRTSRFLPVLLTGGLVLSGGAAVLAASGGSSSKGSASHSQYCSSDAQSRGDRECHPNSPGEGKHKHKKKPRYHVTRSPRRGCTSRMFVASYSVTNMPQGGKSRVFLDGRRLRSTGHRRFTVRVNARRLHRGVHRLTVKAFDSAGKPVAMTIRFRRC